MLRSVSELADGLWARLIVLLQTLIISHPVYGSPAQRKVADLLAEVLREQAWSDVQIVGYRADDLRGHRRFVDVAAFGSEYARDGEIEKYIVVASAKGAQGGPSLIVNCHYDVDVVTAARHWRHNEFWRSALDDGTRVFGRGATDMLAGLAAAIFGLSVFAQHRIPWKGRLLFVAVPDEEIGGNGTLMSLLWMQRAGLFNGPDSAWYCLIPEPSDGRVCLASFGLSTFALRAVTRSCHMGATKVPHGALNQGMQAIRTLDAAITCVLHRHHLPVDENLIVNLGRVVCGEDPSLPPAEFVASGVVFVPPEIDRTMFESEVHDEFQAHGAASVTLSFDSFGFNGAVFTPNQLSAALVEADLALTMGRFRSPCDARLYADFDVPAVIFGPGTLGDAHAVDESISKTELRRYLEQLLSGLIAFLSNGS